MSPVEMALSVAWLIGQEAAGNATWDGIRTLVQRVRERFRGDAGGEKRLESVMERSVDDAAQLELAAAIVHSLANDDQFAQEIAGLLAQAQHAGARLLVVQGNVGVASGERSVAIGGNVQGGVNTGDK